MSEAVESVNPEATSTPEAESAGVAAQPEGTSVQATADALDPVKAAKPVVEEDPEIEFDKDLKLKRSEAANQIRKRKELDRAAFAKFEEASKIRKQLDSLRESDPEEYFKLRGLDPIQFAVERLQREVALKEATPEQRRIMELEAERQSLLSEKQTYEEQQEAQKHDGEKQQFIAKIDKELPAALDKFALPKDPIVFRATALVMRDQIANDMPLDMEAAAETVAEAYRATFKQHAATLTYQDAVKQYPEFVKLVRDGDLARAKSAATAPARPAAQAPAPKKPTDAPDQGKNFNDYFQRIAGSPLSGI